MDKRRVQEQVVIACNNNLVLVWVGIEPMKLGLNLVECAVLRKVAGVKQNVAGRKLRL